MKKESAPSTKSPTEKRPMNQAKVRAHQAARRDRPRPRKAPYLEIVRVPPNGELHFWICSKSVEGYETHYFGKSTYPHDEANPECVGCKMGLPVRWRGYVIATLLPEDKMVLAEITEMGFNGCPDFEKYHGDLAGRELTQKRKGAGINGRQINFISKEYRTRRLVRYIPEIGPILEQIWEGKGSGKEDESHGA
jgi:hypothetical protein